MNHVIIDDQQIAYAIIGNGLHVVLLFPGALGTMSTDFKLQIDFLNRNVFTIVAWDPPGYGSSTPPTRNFNVNFYEEDANVAWKLMDHLGFKEYGLVGWSDGANSSLIMAAKYEQVKRVVAIAGNAIVTEEDVRIYEGIRNIDNWPGDTKKEFLLFYEEHVLRSYSNAWCDVQKVILNEKNGNVCRDVLARIKCPTLIVHGRQDDLVPIHHAEYLRDNIPGSRLFVHVHGKHDVHLEFWPDINQVIERFFENEKV